MRGCGLLWLDFLIHTTHLKRISFASYKHPSFYQTIAKHQNVTCYIVIKPSQACLIPVVQPRSQRLSVSMLPQILVRYHLHLTEGVGLLHCLLEVELHDRLL